MCAFFKANHKNHKEERKNMTEMELAMKQVASSMDRVQLLNLFTRAEAAYHRVMPASEYFENLKREQKEKQEQVEKAKSKTFLILFIVAAAIAVFSLIFIISSSRTDAFSGFFRKVFGVIGLIAAVILFVATLIGKISAKKDAAAAAVRLEELAVLIPQADQKLTQLVQENNNDLSVWQNVCPKECANARYLRTFVSYYEDGRADNLKEGYALFEQMLHRERMEGHAQEQVRAAQAAEAAANRAASDAAAAKASADNAAYWSRYK